MASFLFLYLFLSLPLYLLSSLFFYFFALSLCHSFYFFSIFLEPEPKLFHVTWVNKLHWHFIFYVVCNGKSKQHRQIKCSGFFWLFRWSGVFWGVPECSGVFQSVSVFQCSSVPVFLILVLVILLTIFHNAWQNPVKWLLRARQIRSTSDANEDMPVRRTAHEYFVLGSHRYVLLAFKYNLAMRYKILSIDHYVT